jgi:hypothetical protein
MCRASGDTGQLTVLRPGEKFPCSLNGARERAPGAACRPRSCLCRHRAAGPRAPILVTRSTPKAQARDMIPALGLIHVRSIGPFHAR